MTFGELLVILVGCCALYTVAGLAVKCIERYEQMKRQREFRVDDRVVRIKTKVRV